MSEVYIDLLHSYLNDNEWKKNIETFVESNCSSFKNINEYNHEHYDIWKNFKEIVEQILDMTLSQVGGSIEALEKSLDEIASETPNGPRDEITKDILNRLLTYDDFLVFAKMMKDEANSWNDSMTLSKNLQSLSGHYDTLISMGFSEEMIQLVLDDSTPKECNDLETLVIKLSAIDTSENKNSNKNGAKITDSRNRSGRIIDEFDSFNHNNDYHEIDSREKNRLRRLGLEGNDSNSNDISNNDRPSIAESKTNSNSNSNSYEGELYPHLADFASELATYTFINTNANELNVKFVMAGSLIDTVNSTVGMWDNKSDENGKLLEWASNMMTLLEEIIDCYKKNESYRDRAAKIDRLSSSLSLTEASNGENGLLGWFASLEELRAVVDSHQSEESMLNHGEVERMAVLEHIASMGTDDERLLHSLIMRHDQVQSEINNLHVKCGGMVAAGVIGRMHLEELYLELKNKLNSGADIDNFSEELHEQVYSVVKDAQKGSFVVKSLLDMHILEDEQAMLKSEINSLLGGQSSANGSPMKATSDDEQGLNRDDKIGQDAKLTDVTMATGGLSIDVGGGGRDDDAQVSAELVNELKESHKKDLAKLKAGLSHTKEQRLQALEERLARRRRAHEKENDPTDKESIANSINELEDEITRTERQFQEIHKGIIGGFKKRCVHEMRVLKDKKSALSDEDRHKIALDAGKGIIERHERDQKVLLQNLETERARQRNRLLKKLSKRQKEMGVSSTSEEGKALQLEGEKELQALNDAFDAQEEGALSEPRQKMLVTLSAAFLPQDVFTKKEENEDDYMDEEDAEHKNFLEWVTTTERLTDKYSTAGHILQKRFRRAQRKGQTLNVDEDDDDEEESGMASVTAHMMKVIAEAFASQMQSNDGSNKLNNSGDIGKLLEKDESNENELIKAGILNEFERLRESYDVALENAQLSSRARLEKRRAKAWEGGDNWDMDPLDAGRGMESVTHTQALFEEVIDDFLHDPLKVVEADKSPKKYKSNGNNYNSNSSSHPILGGGGNLAPSEPRITSKMASSNRDKTAAEAITAAHKDAQMDLLEGLNSHMIKMKRSLDARIARRRESKAADGKTDDLDNSEDKQLQIKLEESHRVMVNMIKESNESDLQKMKLDDLTAAVDVVVEGGALPRGILPQTVQSYLEDALAEASRRQMTQRAQRISEEFNEENQKLDLMMKVQQARQRQMLQRKLLQRKGRAANNDGAPMSAARGGQLPPLRSLPRPGDAKQPIPFGGLRATPNQLPVSGIDPNMWGGVTADDKDAKN